MVDYIVVVNRNILTTTVQHLFDKFYLNGFYMNLKNEKITVVIVYLVSAVVYLFLLFTQNGFVIGGNNHLQASAAAGSFIVFIILSLLVFVPFHLKKSQYSHIAFILSLVVFVTISTLGKKGFSINNIGFLGSYNDCILEHSQSLDTLIAVEIVKKSCREKYPLKVRLLSEDELSKLTGGASVVRYQSALMRSKVMTGLIDINIETPNQGYFIKKIVIGLVDPVNKVDYQEFEIEIPERDKGNQYQLKIHRVKYDYSSSNDINWFIKSAVVYTH